jgi:peptidoglycan/xylan/chitin deacetylase (PgdA/CDA1 family)
VSAARAGAVRLANWAGTRTLSPPYGGFGAFHNHGPRADRLVALTFDDGPSAPCTEQLPDVMGELEVPGTFFCVGVNVRWHPEVVARIDREGHVVATTPGSTAVSKG